MALAPQQVGARIRKARQAKGWTHEQLARAMGVNWRTVQRWQKGWDEKNGRSLLPRLGTLMRLADVLEVPQAYFVETEDEQATLEDLRAQLAKLADRQEMIVALLERLDAHKPDAQDDAAQG